MEQGDRLMKCSEPRPGRAHAPRTSDPDAPFFVARPDEDTDLFYDGCWGWD
jgi:hypothetical protein